MGVVNEEQLRRIQIRETIISHFERERALFGKGIKVLSLFFIPLIKWGKRYFVETTCCNAVYELDPEVGRSIARGDDVQIRQEDLTRVVERGYSVKRCKNCGYTTDEDFEFCPKCGNRL